MAEDFRIKTDFFEHPKTCKLERQLGKEGVYHFLRLLAYVREYRPTGVLSEMTDEQVADAARWPHDPSKLIHILVELRFLDRGKKWLSVHDWRKHNAWASYARKRSAQAKKAASARWRKRDKKLQRCGQHANSNAHFEISNAPSPSPSPSPSPRRNKSSDGKIRRTTNVDNSTSDHHRLIAYWTEKYQDKFNLKYDFKRGKDGTAVKRLLKAFGYDLAVKLIDYYLVLDDPFYDLAGRDLAKLYGEAQKLLQRMSKQDGNPETAASCLTPEQAEILKDVYGR